MCGNIGVNRVCQNSPQSDTEEILCGTWESVLEGHTPVSWVCMCELLLGQSEFEKNQRRAVKAQLWVPLFWLTGEVLGVDLP